MRDDIAGLGIFPTISREHTECIEKPAERESIIEDSECMIVWLFAGTYDGCRDVARPG